MHIAVLVTNTDETDFAQKYPKDGEKFSILIKEVRPSWEISIFSVKDDVFPSDITTFDGVLITGSPASVYDDWQWIPRLLDQIRVAYCANVPMFGACFGHQAIAVALGGKVTPNPDGWAFGLLEMQMESRPPWYDGPVALLQYGAHIEQVTQLPDGAEVVFSTHGCPVAGLVIADRVYTTQNHPEMTPEFVTALLAEYVEKLGEVVATRAKNSLERIADRDVFIRSIARFFERNPV